MKNPPVNRDLLEAILELRAEAENRLMQNKYYVAVKKLDELLEAIQPLEAEVIDEPLRGSAEPTALESSGEEQMDELFASDSEHSRADDDEWSVPTERAGIASETYAGDAPADSGYRREAVAEQEWTSGSERSHDPWEHHDDYEHDSEAADSQAA